MEGYPSYPAGMEPQHPTEVAYEAHILSNGDPVEGMAAAKLNAGQRPGGLQGGSLFTNSAGSQGSPNASGTVLAQNKAAQPVQQQPDAAPQGHRDYLNPQPDGSLQIKGPLYLRWVKPPGIINGIIGGAMALDLPGYKSIPSWITQLVGGAVAGEVVNDMEAWYPWLTWEPEQAAPPEQPEQQAPFEASPNDGLA